MSANSEQIVAALRGKTTGLTTREIREATSVKGNINGVIAGMVKRGQLDKHEGETPRSTRYSLNPKFVADAPPPAAKKRKAKKGRKKTRRAAPPQRAPKPPPERSFIPAITADRELIVVDRDRGDVKIFNPEDTEAIASLVFSQFSA